MTDTQEPTEKTSAESAPPIFELAVSREEIYADSDSGKYTSSLSVDRPSPAPEEALGLKPVVPSETSVSPTTGLFVARRRKTVFERFQEHTVLWTSTGALLALTIGFFAALWFSSSALKSDIQTHVTKKDMLEEVPLSSRDHEKIAQLNRRIQEERISIAWKTGALWTLVSAGCFWGWNRFFHEQ